MELTDINQIKEDGLVVFMPSGTQATLFVDGDDIIVEYPEMYRDKYTKEQFKKLMGEGIFIFNDLPTLQCMESKSLVKQFMDKGYIRKSLAEQYLEGYSDKNIPDGSVYTALKNKKKEYLTTDFKNELLTSLDRIAKEYPNVKVRQQAVSFMDDLGMQEYYDTKAVKDFIKKHLDVLNAHVNESYEDDYEGPFHVMIYNDDDEDPQPETIDIEDEYDDALERAKYEYTHSDLEENTVVTVVNSNGETVWYIDKDCEEKLNESYEDDYNDRYEVFRDVEGKYFVAVDTGMDYNEYRNDDEEVVYFDSEEEAQEVADELNIIIQNREEDYNKDDLDESLNEVSQEVVDRVTAKREKNTTIARNNLRRVDDEHTGELDRIYRNLTDKEILAGKADTTVDAIDKRYEPIEKDLTNKIIQADDKLNRHLELKKRWLKNKSTDESLNEDLQLVDKAEPDFQLGDAYIAKNKEDLINGLDKLILGDTIGAFVNYLDEDGVTGELNVEMVDEDLFKISMEEYTKENADDWEGKDVLDTEFLTKEETINQLNLILEHWEILDKLNEDRLFPTKFNTLPKKEPVHKVGDKVNINGINGEIIKVKPMKMSDTSTYQIKLDNGKTVWRYEEEINESLKEELDWTDKEFCDKMLDRLLDDCETFLKNPRLENLWAKDIDEHMDYVEKCLETLGIDILGADLYREKMHKVYNEKNVKNKPVDEELKEPVQIGTRVGTTKDNPEKLTGTVKAVNVANKTVTVAVDPTPEKHNGEQKEFSFKDLDIILKEELGPYAETDAVGNISIDIEMGNKSGFEPEYFGNWILNTSLDDKWEQLTTDMKHYVLEKIASPVADGHMEYTDLEIIIDSTLTKEDIESLDIFLPDEIEDVENGKELQFLLSYNISSSNEVGESFKLKNKKKKKKLDELNKIQIEKGESMKKTKAIKEEAFKVYNNIDPDAGFVSFDNYEDVDAYLNQCWGEYKASMSKENREFGTDEDKQNYLNNFDLEVVDIIPVQCDDTECTDIVPCEDGECTDIECEDKTCENTECDEEDCLDEALEELDIYQKFINSDIVQNKLWTLAKKTLKANPNAIIGATDIDEDDIIEEYIKTLSKEDLAKFDTETAENYLLDEMNKIESDMGFHVDGDLDEEFEEFEEPIEDEVIEEPTETTEEPEEDEDEDEEPEIETPEEAKDLIDNIEDAVDGLEDFIKTLLDAEGEDTEKEDASEEEIQEMCMAKLPDPKTLTKDGKINQDKKVKKDKKQSDVKEDFEDGMSTMLTNINDLDFPDALHDAVDTKEDGSLLRLSDVMDAVKELKAQFTQAIADIKTELKTSLQDTKQDIQQDVNDVETRVQDAQSAINNLTSEEEDLEGYEDTDMEEPVEGEETEEETPTEETKETEEPEQQEESFNEDEQVENVIVKAIEEILAEGPMSYETLITELNDRGFNTNSKTMINFIDKVIELNDLNDKIITMEEEYNRKHKNISKYLRKGFLEDLPKLKTQIDKLIGQGKSAEDIKNTITLGAEDEEEEEKAAEYAVDRLKESLECTSKTSILARELNKK